MQSQPSCWPLSEKLGGGSHCSLGQVRWSAALGALMSPVTSHPNPLATTVNPMAWNPPRIMMRIIDVVAGNPYVAPSVPLPMPRVPNVIATWRRWHCLNPSRRRSDAHNNLGSHGLGGQTYHGPSNHQSSNRTKERETFQSVAHI